MDERAVDSPTALRIDRRPSDYLHFGYNTCFGAAIGQVQVPTIVTAPLKGRAGSTGASGKTALGATVSERVASCARVRFMR